MRFRSTCYLLTAGALLVSACSAPAAAPAAPTTAPAPTAAKPAATTVPTAAQPAATGGPAAAQPTTAAAVSQYSEDLKRDAGTTVDTTKYKKDGPYTIAALTQGPGNGWGLTYDVSIRAAAEGNPNIKKLIFTPNDGDANKEISAMEDAR